MGTKLEELLAVLKDAHILQETPTAPERWESTVMAKIKSRNVPSSRKNSLESATGFIWQLCAVSLVLTVGLQAYLSSVTANISGTTDVYAAAFSTNDVDQVWSNNEAE